MRPGNQVNSLLLLFCMMLAGMGCAQKREIRIAQQPPILWLSDTTLTQGKDLFAFPALQRFYRNRQFRMAWFDQQGKIADADSLFNILHKAAHYGLVAREYHVAELTQLLQPVFLEKATLHEQERTEILLTNGFLSIARHLQKGRFTKNSNKRLQQLPLADTVLAKALEHALNTKKLRRVLEALEPQHLQYQQLKAGLARHISQTTAANPADSAVHEQRWQEQQIAANMERWRWEPSFPDSYIMINLPAYQLQLYRHGRLVLESRIIIGKPATPSPELDGAIECLIIYPYWTVPRSIAVQELLPKVQQDPAYLQRNNYEVLDRQGKVLSGAGPDWQAYSADHFPFTFRQREGLDNALGIVKFSFDNPYSVYLHDTNARQLFNNQKRALSHGCIRVEKAQELAQLLVSEDSAFHDPAVLAGYFIQKKKREISLPKPLPLYIRYFTVVPEQGSLVFYPDIYQKDPVMVLQ